MRTLTVVTPTTRELPRDMSPLAAPARLVSGEEAGVAVGVVLEEDAGILAFVIEVAESLERGAPWALVTASAVTVTDSEGLLISLSRDALLKLPRLRRADPVAHPGADPTAGAASAGGSANAKTTIAEGIEGGAIGAAAGVIAGMAAGGPVVVALAAFFAAGGALLGLVSGASTRVDETEEAKRVATSTSDASRAAMGRFAAMLHDPMLGANGVVSVHRFTVEGSNADRKTAPASTREFRL